MCDQFGSINPRIASGARTDQALLRAPGQAEQSHTQGVTTGAVKFQTMLNKIRKNTSLTTQETTALGGESMTLSDTYGIATRRLASATCIC